MTDTIIVLTEDTLASADVEKLLALHEGESYAYRVLVPADTARPLVSTIIDNLSMGELREAWDRARGKEPSHPEAKATADEQLAGSIAAFVAAGRVATGAVVDDDPLPALKAAVADGDVAEVAVVTYPHAVEDTFHTDWASRARHKVGVPVLKLFSHSKA